MSFKTLLAIIITIGLTTFIIQNQDRAVFTVLFGTGIFSKTTVLLTVAISAFILGVIVARPTPKKAVREYDDDDENDDDTNGQRKRFDTLSDEDRDYIS